MVTLGFTGTGEGSLGGQEEPDTVGRADEKQIRPGGNREAWKSLSLSE